MTVPTQVHTRPTKERKEHIARKAPLTADHETIEYAPMDADNSIRQLLALDDAALVPHMLHHRDAEGRINITHVKDWDDAPEAAQIELRERFR
jgi:hypothetical protein